MFNRTESDIRHSESLLRDWRSVSPRDRWALAHQVAERAKENEPSDPFVFNRVYSRLMNNVECPQEHGISNAVISSLIAAHFRRQMEAAKAKRAA